MERILHPEFSRVHILLQSSQAEMLSQINLAHLGIVQHCFGVAVGDNQPFADDVRAFADIERAIAAV